MKYPIDPDKYITVLHLLYGPDVNEDVYRTLIPVVNDCYGAGLRGEGGFPIGIDEVICYAVEKSSHPPDVVAAVANKSGPPMVRWFNQAYEQGRQDAEKEGMFWESQTNFSSGVKLRR